MVTDLEQINCASSRFAPYAITLASTIGGIRHGCVKNGGNEL